MEKLNEIPIEKTEGFKFCSARFIKKSDTLYNFEMTYSLHHKKMMCIIEHGNLFGEENEIENFSNWHLN